MMHIEFPPYFGKILKFPPIFVQFTCFLKLICVYSLPLYFYHDAFMHHALSQIVTSRRPWVRKPDITLCDEAMVYFVLSISDHEDVGVFLFHTYTVCVGVNLFSRS